MDKETVDIGQIETLLGSICQTQEDINMKLEYMTVQLSEEQYHSISSGLLSIYLMLCFLIVLEFRKLIKSIVRKQKGV
ncbi:MAG: hypothetical protein J1E35_03600 [Lachnospiraceae bacterium]|nr:hypothetical protein [Lachnospiraceae bacterium]